MNNIERLEVEVVRSPRLTHYSFKQTLMLNFFLFFYFFQLAQVSQSLPNSGGRTPVNHQQSFTDKLDDAIFPQGASPPPHMNNIHTPTG